MDNRYKIKKRIAKGGMGEVFLAYDTVAKRDVALKKIREDLAKKDVVIKRFLREAKIASTLSHPSIVPIYDIHLKEPYFYTMPFVEGKTLKEIIKEATLDEKHIIGNSIQSLVRIFLNVCEATAYIHSKNILHRDLKPDNIIIGKYGEVLILDWGIAKFLDEKEIDKDLDIKAEDLELTMAGKVAGTLSYMAPKRALGYRATNLTDIYSLGAILYHLLTLEMPFKRRDLKIFRKTHKLEKILEPIEKAPKRDIPKSLNDIAMKCLAEEKFRYQNMQELIDDLKNYIEGKPEWILTANLDLKNVSDWQFEENILLTENIAISKKVDFAHWVTLMVSKLSFSSNIKIEADISFKKFSKGLGLFLNILKNQNSFQLDEGYKLWLNPEKKESEISRSNVLIFNDKLNLKPNVFYHLEIEKVDDKLNVYIDKKLIFSHINHLPIRGNYFALAYEDNSFSIKDLKIYTSTYNVMVNCLAIADAFFAKEDYDTAIKEYEKITFSFPSRKEGLEAIFRSGISYLEKAKKLKSNQRQKYLDLAMIEFEKLHFSTFEPLEYLGKSLVYLEKKDFIEEAKCLELMIRKFSRHHQSPILFQYIIYRMHQSSHQNREAAFRIALIGLRFIPNLLDNLGSKKFLDRLENNLENIYFFEKSDDLIHYLSIKLSYILNNKSALLEILNIQDLDKANIENIIFSLIELEEIEKANELLKQKKEILDKTSYKLLLLCFHHSFEKALDELFKQIHKKPSVKESRVLIYLVEKILDEKKYEKVIKVFESIKKLTLAYDLKILLDSFLTKAYLIENKTKLASKIFNKYKLEKISDEKSPLHFLYGLWLYKNESKEISSSYFSNILEIQHPSSFAISSHLISNKNKDFLLKKAFYFEKRRLLKDLLLYSLVLNDKKILKISQKILIN
ncbi:MAG: Serine/threonine-protein kinase PknD [Candidatus Anoxychlamydiales bacterium]|nr:Serine/threonine-protein kinase PknD [Candidatus Anoxychlamydiales bacterium]